MSDFKIQFEIFEVAEYRDEYFQGEPVYITSEFTIYDQGINVRDLVINALGNFSGRVLIEGIDGTAPQHEGIVAEALKNGQIFYETTTRPSGIFEFQGLEENIYTLRLSKQGYYTLTDQFEIIGMDDFNLKYPSWRGRGPDLNGKTIYRRIMIKNKKI